MSEAEGVVAEPEVVAPPAEPEVPAVPPDPEAAELAALEAGAVELPEGEQVLKYVPLSAATTARQQAKEARQQAKEAKDALATAQAALDASKPYVEAAKAILSQPQAPAAPVDHGPTPEERAKLDKIARLYDFYKTDGTIDYDRAIEHRQMVLAEARDIAAAEVAPYQQQNDVQRAQSVLNVVTAWKDPVTGEQADPAVLRDLWNRVAAQPNGLATLQNKEAATFIWGQALHETRWKKGKVAAPAQEPAGPPVFVEPSGGGAQVPSLSAMERKLAKEYGLSDSEYLKAAKDRPRG